MTELGSDTLPSVGQWQQILTAPPVWQVKVQTASWTSAALALRDQGGRLLGLWGEAGHENAFFYIHALGLGSTGYLWITLTVQSSEGQFPSLADIFPAASRMERALYDLTGIRAAGNADTRPWLRHQCWPAGIFPLREGQLDGSSFGVDGDADYPFQLIDSVDVHQIPVGPVHAGTIEPGHFRFSCVGEQILRLEERLGYTHKGVERLFQDRDVFAGARLAGRISGDTTAGYAWAYSMAVESIARCEIPPRAAALRAVCLERERMANHLGDLAALGNDAGFAFCQSQFLFIKESLLRENQEIFGHRYLMDCIIPGGVAFDLNSAQTAAIQRNSESWQRTVQRLDLLLQEHSGLRDRLVGTGKIVPPRAAALGMAGLAGRASGQAWDLRVQFPHAPYQNLDVSMQLSPEGDVAARWQLRFREFYESLRLQTQLLLDLPSGDVSATIPESIPDGEGLGIVEAWRGEVFVALSVENARIKRCHPHDPSWTLWPVLEEAVLNDIVADFPLINKSFNLSYSGHDL
ncbi:Ni,Fe-hydrogenase III large subunit [Acidithiobacillus thiooxidans]|uniref:hydrogenase large subunit n=1 Tax=Acidithiobacillus thiooxidans TaxID=930 RepID=UPI0002624A31|nr:NADH-quinone oxidoreductase subunit C [Acidithiobacillus thiooxidans]MBU2810840.1 Ni,Fe-hydrogenase III large subunit [Acidithiobacillus thiooxidans]